MKQLSPLASKLFDKLNQYSHIFSLEIVALAMYEDQTLSRSQRNAYYEVYEYCRDNY